MTAFHKQLIRPAQILLPKAAYLTAHWPVVALDQYTSQKEIWLQAEALIGTAPSTLRLILPEAFLDQAAMRGEAATKTMQEYLDRQLFDLYPDSFVLSLRHTQSGTRAGLVLCIDLEAYDYTPGSQSKIRATEETVLERIPPRQAVREQSALELSHVLLLVDDPMDSLLGPLVNKLSTLPLLYDLNLLMDGGRLQGFLVNQLQDHQHLASTLSRMEEAMKAGDLLLAVGDGNHSLAAAKASWEKQKQGLSEAQMLHHPARFALAELINLHSPALHFEPIHRLAFDATPQQVLNALKPLAPIPVDQGGDLTLIHQGSQQQHRLSQAGPGLLTQQIQALLDSAGFSLDYVHGVMALNDILKSSPGTGILMPDFKKDQLFPTVKQEGRLPRKTFSMGEANEKRFYMETRRIR